MVSAAPFFLGKIGGFVIALCDLSFTVYLHIPDKHRARRVDRSTGEVDTGPVD